MFAKVFLGTNRTGANEELNIITDEERNKLLEPTNEEEIEFILKYEVDLDSSPGEDGLTYRIIKTFWVWQEFRDLYIDFLNFTRKGNCTGLIDNCGIMTVKNKKV